MLAKTFLPLGGRQLKINFTSVLENSGDSTPIIQLKNDITKQ